MPFVKHKIWTGILNARKNGDPDASRIYDKFFDKGCRQDELDRLIEQYLHPVAQEPEQQPDPEAEEAIAENESINDAPQAQPVGMAVVDISGDLDGELDGLIDDDELDEDDFETFLKKKKQAANRARKNNGYFKAFDAEGRKNYLAKKNDEYGHKYDTKRRDIERAFRDMGSALGKYSQSVTDLPDDGIDYTPEGTDSAYNNIVDSSGESHSFGRGWDEQDLAQVASVLKGLVGKYGKKNVVAALNLLTQDNIAHRNARIDSIDKAVRNYGTKLKDLLGD